MLNFILKAVRNDYDCCHKLTNILFSHTSMADVNYSEELKLQKKIKIKDMMKDYNNITDIKTMYSNFSTSELDQTIFNMLHSTEVEWNKENEESSINELKEPILDKKLLRATSDYINFVDRKRNDPLTTDQVQFLKSQIEVNELSVKQISSKFYVSLSVLYKIKRRTSNIINRGCLRRLTRLDPRDKI